MASSFLKKKTPMTNIGSIMSHVYRLILTKHQHQEVLRKAPLLKYDKDGFFQVVHEIRNYPYPQLHLLALQSLNPSRHATAVRESYEVIFPFTWTFHLLSSGIKKKVCFKMSPPFVHSCGAGAAAVGGQTGECEQRSCSNHHREIHLSSQVQEGRAEYHRGAGPSEG